MEKLAIVDNRKKLICFFSFFTLTLLFVTNLYISGTLELSFDESYYWIYSKYPSFGYFDHPPMVGWSIFLGTFIFGDNEFGVRFMSHVYLLGTFLLMAQIMGRKLYDEYLISLVISMPLIIMSGLVALPDTPLMFFTTLFFYQVKNYTEKDNVKNSIFLALSIATMFYSKYHGLLIVVLTVFGCLSFFKRKSFWGIILLVVLLYLPHMIWQYQHDFISFKFHLFGRVEKHFSLLNISNYILGQFFLMGFFCFALFTHSFWKHKFKDPFDRILIFNSFGFLAFLLLMSFRNQIEANWTISCSIAFILLMSRFMKNYGKVFGGFVFINILLFLLVRVVLFAPGKFIDPSKDSRLNEVWGWKARVQTIQDLCSGKMIVGDNYQVTSKVAFYLGKPEIPSLHLGSRDSHYKILNLEKKISFDEQICYLTSKNIMGASKVETGYKDPVYVVPTTSLGKIADYYGISYEEIIRE